MLIVWRLIEKKKKKTSVRFKHEAVRSPGKRYEFFFYLPRNDFTFWLQTAEIVFSAYTANKSVLYIIVLCSAEKRTFHYNILLNVRSILIFIYSTWRLRDRRTWFNLIFLFHLAFRPISSIEMFPLLFQAKTYCVFVRFKQTVIIL
jgi:hypothetical protein